MQRSRDSSAHIIARHLHPHCSFSSLLTPQLVPTLLSDLVLFAPSHSFSSMVFTPCIPLARFSSPFSIILTAFTHFLFSSRDSTYILLHHSGLSPFSIGCLLFPYFMCNSTHAFSTSHTSSRVLRSTVLSLPCSCTPCLTSHTSISVHHSPLAAFLTCS